MIDDDEAYGLHCDIGRLEVENAKLRKLAHDLLQPILADGFDCYGCVHEDCDGMRYTDRCKLLDRACELGVEVKENDVSAGLRVEDAERTQ